MDPLKLFNFDNDPFKNFDTLFTEVQRLQVPEPNAMNIATVSANGQPSVRVVLFKGFYDEGFGFFTNYQGRKGQELAANPRIGCNFFWPQVGVQVRIDGRTEKLSRAESEEYFNSRPRISQLGAWASQQSAELRSRAEIEQRYQEVEKKFDGMQVPCPPYWGGYRVLATEIEFWFAVVGRLHHRYVYTRSSPDQFCKNPADVVWKKWMKNP